MARPFSLRVDGRAVILAGELDLATVGQFEAQVEALASEPGDVVLDASGLEFLDSSGIRAIFSLARSLRDGRLKIVQPGEQVRRVLELVHADAIVELVEQG